MIFSVFNTKVGYIRIEEEDSKIVSIKKVENFSGDYGQVTETTDRACKEINEYFSGIRKDFTFPYEMRGTDFQKKVWDEICKIPYGQTRSYKEVAERIGNKSGSRAVGMACKQNPLIILTPCHRVVGSSGKLGGYSGGIEMKRLLLNMEALQYTKEKEKHHAITYY